MDREIVLERVGGSLRGFHEGNIVSYSQDSDSSFDEDVIRRLLELYISGLSVLLGSLYK